MKPIKLVPISNNNMKQYGLVTRGGFEFGSEILKAINVLLVTRRVQSLEPRDLSKQSPSGHFYK